MEDNKKKEPIDIVDVMNMSVSFPGLPKYEDIIEFRGFHIISRIFLKGENIWNTYCAQCICPDEIDKKIFEKESEGVCPDHNFCITTSSSPYVDHFRDEDVYPSDISDLSGIELIKIRINRHYGKRHEYEKRE
jgi:hypothetical protein